MEGFGSGNFVIIEHGPHVIQPVERVNGAIVYTAKSGYTGTDAFTYEIRDAGGAVSTATVTVTVEPVVQTGADVGPQAAVAGLARHQHNRTAPQRRRAASGNGGRRRTCR